MLKTKHKAQKNQEIGYILCLLNFQNKIKYFLPELSRMTAEMRLSKPVIVKYWILRVKMVKKLKFMTKKGYVY